jgi:hypothetical protein
MSGNQKGRAPAELWSLEQAMVWIEKRAGVPQHLIQMAPTTMQELYQALKAGMITASGCVDGSERRDVSPGEWNDYRLTLKHIKFPNHYFMGSAGTPIIEVLSIRSFPAAALKYHGYRSGVRIPSASAQDGDPGYHRVITDVLLRREEVIRQWPSSGRVPLPNNRSTDLDSKSGPGAKTRGIEQAIGQLWPSGIPEGLSAKDRNNMVIDWLRQKGYSVPGNPERAIQRVLKARLTR